jgi:hypothetical protein
MKTITEQKPKVQELQGLEDLGLLVSGDVINVVDETGRENLAIFLEGDGPFLRFVCQDLDSKEHMNYFVLSYRLAKVENNSLKYDPKNLFFERKIHKPTLRANRLYSQLREGGLSD